MSDIIHAVDLFCGAGGTSTGLYRACHSLGRRVDLLAINHWKVAVETHAANHPGARHMCATLDSIRPEDAVKGGRLDLLVASPECTHHSIARGGRPVLDQMRASAWLILRWIETLRVDNVLIENVREFRDWGPVGATGKPLRSRKGETYRAFLNALRSFGYAVEDRILNAADYGDATSRKRLFILARRGRKKIAWPPATHGEPDTLKELLLYRTAREIIDWSIKGQSIFDRKRPLAPSTIARIAAGLKKFGGARPFLCETNHGGNGSRAHSVDLPLPTVTTKNGYALCEPFIVRTDNSGANGKCVRGIDEPLSTITTSCGHALVEPFLVKYYGKSGIQSVDKPLDTITTQDRFGLVEVSGKYQINIRFRMLQPHELAAAMGFANYTFTGTKHDQVKQIGNAVPVRMAEALCAALLTA
jgi:DNA (cytosine-5)-methyltransferase 1